MTLVCPPGYEVMHKQALSPAEPIDPNPKSLTLTLSPYPCPEGAIILGIGGDNSPWAAGTFFEGVMTKGYASEETDVAVMANVAAAGYKKRA